MLKKVAIKDGGILPPSLANKPVLSMFQRPYYDAFHCLNGSRAWTMSGPASIPLSEIVAYLSMNDITDAEEREEYIMFIQALDSAYLDHTYKNIKNKRTTA